MFQALLEVFQGSSVSESLLLHVTHRSYPSRRRACSYDMMQICQKKIVMKQYEHPVCPKKTKKCKKYCQKSRKFLWFLGRIVRFLDSDCFVNHYLIQMLDYIHRNLDNTSQKPTAGICGTSVSQWANKVSEP